MRNEEEIGLEVDLKEKEKDREIIGKKRNKEKNIKEMKWKEVNEFYEKLNEEQVKNIDMRMIIMKGVRQGKISQINERKIEGNVWKIKGEEMKGRKDEKNELSVKIKVEEMKVIDIERRNESEGFILKNVRSGVIRDMKMGMLMRREKIEESKNGLR